MFDVRFERLVPGSGFGVREASAGTEPEHEQRTENPEA